MSKEDLIEFLKENLSISVNDKHYDFYSGSKEITITLHLGDEELSTDTFYIEDK